MRTWIGRLPLLPISAAGFQSLIMRYAWGTIWTRPVLDQKTRRRLVRATTSALGKWGAQRAVEEVH